MLFPQRDRCDVSSHRTSGHEYDAFGFELFESRDEYALVEFEIRDTVSEKAANAVRLLVDRHVVPLSRELLRGTTLGRVLRAGPMPALRACKIAAQIATGLQAVHDRGIVHRDLKPKIIPSPTCPLFFGGEAGGS